MGSICYLHLYLKMLLLAAMLALGPEAAQRSNAASEIESIDVGATNTAFTYDDAGNLTSDGTYDYEYDAWGRLVKVYAAGTSTWIVHFTYDGLGRLVRLQRPYSGFLNGQRIEHSWAQ